MTRPLVRFPSLLILLAIVLLVGLTATSGSGQPGKDKAPPEIKFKLGDNHLPDKARWEWTLLDAAGKQVGQGTFSGRTNGTLTTGKDAKAKQIGTWKPAANPGQMTLVFTAGPLMGTAEIQFLANSGKRPTLEGVHVSKKAKNKLRVEIIND